MPYVRAGQAMTASTNSASSAWASTSARPGLAGGPGFSPHARVIRNGSESRSISTPSGPISRRRTSPNPSQTPASTARASRSAGLRPSTLNGSSAMLKTCAASLAGSTAGSWPIGHLSCGCKASASSRVSPAAGGTSGSSSTAAGLAQRRSPPTSKSTRNTIRRTPRTSAVLAATRQGGL